MPALDRPRKRVVRSASQQETNGRASRSRKQNGDEAANGHQDDDEEFDLDADDVSNVASSSKMPFSPKLQCTTLHSWLAPQRAHILERLSGKVSSHSDLVCFEEQATMVLQTLESTIKRSESNSILLMGPRGSGKTALLDSTLAMLGPPGSYHHVYIDSRSHTTDRSAMREMARQLIDLGALSLGSSQQLGLDEDEEDEAEQLESDDEDAEEGGDAALAEDDDDKKAALETAVLSSMSNTTSSILSLLASSASSSTDTSGRPLIITLDSFDLLTARPRQALLYCLLDAVQSGTYRPGLAIVGMTRRVDTTDLLEKRVKSRFSHRIVQCYPPAKEEDWKQLVRKTLTVGLDTLAVQAEGDDVDDTMSDGQAFADAWIQATDQLLDDPRVPSFLSSITDLSRDVQVLFEILYLPILELSPSCPHFVTLERLVQSSTSTLYSDRTLSILYDLPTLPLLFLIASKHLQTRDRSVFNFEVALDEVIRFSKRSRRNREAAGTGGLGLRAGEDRPPNTEGSTSLSPSKRKQTTINGGSQESPSEWEDRRKGMMAFERLLDLEIFLPDAFLASLSFLGGSTTTTRTIDPKKPTTTAIVAKTNNHSVRREYMRVRCICEPNVIVTVAKERGRRGTLATEVVQWATRGG